MRTQPLTKHVVTKRSVRSGLGVILVAALAALLPRAAPTIIADDEDPLLQAFPTPTGEIRSVSASEGIDSGNPFFQDLGTNGRSCVTCHQASDAWTISAAHVQQRFDVDGGVGDPLFRRFDGSNCPDGDQSTEADRRAAYSLLLSKGLIRIPRPVPADGEFVVENIDDPYGCAAYNHSTEISVYRRPLPTTNLKFLSGVMWDGREKLSDLATQAKDATLGHAQASVAPSDAALAQIVAFETALSTAATRDAQAGELDAHGALGGPEEVALLPFFIGINDPLTFNPTQAPFDPHVFTLFNPWMSIESDGEQGDDDHSYAEARRSVARGQELFNTFPITISGVSGLNDEFGLPPKFQASCTVCHDAPNAGNHSVAAPLNIGLTDASRRTPDLPLFTLRNKLTGEEKLTTDPGRALVTGKWKDIGRFKGPILRGLAARAPYFHNGSAATLKDVVEFYQNRFSLNLTPQREADLVAFLRSL